MIPLPEGSRLFTIPNTPPVGFDPKTGQEVIADRIKAHHDAGANHVCIQPFRADGAPGQDLALLEDFAPAKQ